jgi:hypothetical protein
MGETMKSLFLLLLCFLSFSAMATDIACKVTDEELGTTETINITLGLDGDTFKSEDDNFVLSPEKGDRLRWKIMDIFDMVIFLNARTGQFEGLDDDGNLKELSKVDCKNVDEALAEEVVQILTPGKLAAQAREDTDYILEVPRDVEEYTPNNDLEIQDFSNKGHQK